MRFLLASALTLAVPAVTLAQQVRTDGTRIALGRDSLPIYLIRGTDTTQTGSVVDDVRTVQLGGVEGLQRVYRSQDRLLGRRLDTLVDVRSSLKPVRHASRSDRGIELVAFSDSGATGVARSMRGDSTIIRAPLASHVINSAAVDFFLRGAALVPGFVARIEVFSPTTRGVVVVQARVTGSEVVAREDCWRVQTDFGGTPVTFWIGKESRRLNRQLMQLRPDIAVLFERGGIASASSSRAI